MDQKPDVPQDLPAKTPNPNTAGSGAGHIDLDKVLLPKKPVPGKTVESAARVNAGALLEQEQHASLKNTVPATPATPPPPRKKTEEETTIAPLQTYKGDIESLIQTTNASTVSIAAAEAARRAQTPLVDIAPAINWQGLVKRSGMVIVGVVLFVVAGGALYWTYQQLNTIVAIPTDIPSPFITVDKTTPIAVDLEAPQPVTLMNTLEAARNSSILQLGLIERFALFHTVTTETGDVPTSIDARAVLSNLAPNIPTRLLDTLTGVYVLGIHVYEGTQPFLLLEVDSYERAFASMLEWEPNMRTDLLPLFAYEPRPRLPEEVNFSAETELTPQLLRTGFNDYIIDNRDTRVILNTAGDVLLLWTPLTPNLFVITTNEYTLRELISRLGTGQ